MFLLIGAACLLAILGALVYRWKSPGNPKFRIKRKRMERERIENCLRSCQHLIIWEPEWPYLLEVYLIYDELSEQLRAGPAALRSLIKKKFQLDQRTSMDIAKRFYEVALPIINKQFKR